MPTVRRERSPVPVRPSVGHVVLGILSFNRMRILGSLDGYDGNKVDQVRDFSDCIVAASNGAHEAHVKVGMSDRALRY